MYKLIVFDLDNTLCKSGEAMSLETAHSLFELMNKGYKLAIASGKPVYYLTGFARAAGLKDMIFLGENGTVLSFGVKLPPKERYVYPYDKKINKTLREIKERIEEEIEGIYFQPNEIMVTPFPKGKEQFECIENILSTFNLEGITVYRHPTCYDILPSVIHKGNSLDYLCKLLGIENKDVLSVGDAINDVPLFEHSGLSISIGDQVKEYTDICFPTIEEALEYIMEFQPEKVIF